MCWHIKPLDLFLTNCKSIGNRCLSGFLFIIHYEFGQDCRLLRRYRQFR